jgi:hypothetical protein
VWKVRLTILRRKVYPAIQKFGVYMRKTR